MADIGGLYAAFDCERERPDRDVLEVATEFVWEERIDTGDGSWDEAIDERDCVFSKYCSSCKLETALEGSGEFVRDWLPFADRYSEALDSARWCVALLGVRARGRRG